MQGLKRLLPLFRKPTVVKSPTSHDLEPPADVMVVARVEQPPILIPFQQIEQFLERESGISDPEEYNRSVKIEKLVYVSPIDRESPAYITIKQQGSPSGKWSDKIQVSIHVVRDYELKRAMEKMKYRVGAKEDDSGGLVLSNQEPALTVAFGLGSPLWQILYLPRPHTVTDTRLWTRFGRRAPLVDLWTTNDPEQLRRVKFFITTGDTPNSTPKVLKRGH